MASINPLDRKTQELLEKQFTKSLSILEPLKARIKATNELMDEINETKEIFYHKKSSIYPEQGEGSSLKRVAGVTHS